MATSSARTVAAYLKELPPDRRRVLSAVRQRILANLPDGYEESMTFGMITYGIPLARYPDTYNGQPLCYAGLAAQKSYNALYLMGPYAVPGQQRELEDAFKQAGKKLDMGKSCVRFRDLDDLPLEAIGRIIAGTPPDRMIAAYEKSRWQTAAGGKKRASKPRTPPAAKARAAARTRS
jgi:hypothetical protein